MGVGRVFGGSVHAECLVASEVKFRPLLSDLTMRRADMRRKHLAFSTLSLLGNQLNKRRAKIPCPEALGWCEATDIYPTSETQL